MNFIKQNEKKITDFILKYNSDENFKEKVERKYFVKPYELAMYEIYALEEILRYGDKNIFNDLKKICDKNKDIKLSIINDYITLLSNDIMILNYKLEQLRDDPDSLNNFEKDILKIYFNKTLEDLYKKSYTDPKETHDKLCDEMFNYDPLNPILFGSVKEIKLTLINLFIGEAIFNFLEEKEFKPIKLRQKERGLIADIDKEILFEILYPLVSEDYEKIEEMVNNRLIKVLFNIKLGKGEEAFSEYLKYNTNISIEEILEYGKNKKK